MDRRVAALLRVQAAYYGLTGVWPFLDMKSFQALTGPKASPWLVKTVGALVGVVGASLAWTTREERLRQDTILLAVGSAAALGAIDLRYALVGRISRTYLTDAAAQAALVAAWIRVLTND